MDNDITKIRSMYGLIDTPRKSSRGRGDKTSVAKRPKIVLGQQPTPSRLFKGANQLSARKTPAHLATSQSHDFCIDGKIDNQASRNTVRQIPQFAKTSGREAAPTGRTTTMMSSWLQV